MSEPRIDAWLFDLDGTLADTAPDLAAALNRLREDHGLPPLPFEQLRPQASHGARGLLQVGFQCSPEDLRFAALRAAFLAHYERALCVNSRLFEGAAQVLDALEQRGIPWGIVTNKVEYLTLPLLARLGLDRRAAVVVCGDTTPHAKPHPEPLLHAVRQLGVAPLSCVYVGDGERDMQAAQQAGMLGMVASYGYIAATESPRDWPAMAWLEAPDDILRWL